MAHVTYSYLICRTFDGFILDELPLSTSALPRKIGVDSTTEFALPLDDPRVGPEWAGLVDPKRLPMVVVLRDGEPVWGGLITTGRGTTTMSLGAVSFEGWLARRAYPPPGFEVNHEGDDQFIIARAIVDTAAGMGFLGDGLGMFIDTSLTPATSGVARDRHYLSAEPSDCLTRLTQLAGVIKGFEWTIELDYTSGDTAVVPRLVLGYPMIGTRSTQPEWRFEMGVGGIGGNMVDYDVATDASAGKFATAVTSYGSGEGEVRLISEPAVDEAWENEIGLRVQAATTYSTVIKQTTIDEHAEGDLAALKQGETIMAATVRAGPPSDEPAAGDPEPRFGQYKLGDDARMVVEDSPRHPRHADGTPGLDHLTRIIGWTLDPATDTVALEFGTGRQGIIPEEGG